jgi:hypothetical protein
MSGVVYPDGCTPIDCSPEAQADRWEKLKGLRDKLYSGVQSISDRSRSVSYYDGVSLRKLISALENEMALCSGCLNRRMTARRIFTVPYDKWL